MAITCQNPAVTPAGRACFTHAIRHAWAAGDLDSPAVHELTQLAMGIVRQHAITPASLASHVDAITALIDAAVS